MIEVLSATALATVQDMGRHHHRRFGVDTSGAMDRLALAIGNVLLDNPEDAAGIEVQLFPYELRFRKDACFALTGADCDASLDSRPILPFWATRAQEGQVLTLRAPAVGARCYVCVAGGIDVPMVLGSRSTHLRAAFGGHCGRELRAGDILPINGAASSHRLDVGFGVEPPDRSLPCGESTADVTTVRVLPASEYRRFSRETLDSFWRTDWKITPQSNRAGYRLSGPALALEHPIEMRSHGIVPGVIQVPPGGAPIVQMCDAQTAGGYPKIATVIEADLWRLGQARLGSKLRFVETSYGDAVAALDEVRAYLDELRRLAALYRARARA